jgi:hypothetical protein
MPAAYLVRFPLLYVLLPQAETNVLSLGEDALANLSIEKEGEDGPITGFVRIRSRSQGLALSLGSLKGLKASTV